MWNDFSITLLEQVTSLTGILMRDRGASYTLMAGFGAAGEGAAACGAGGGVAGGVVTPASASFAALLLRDIVRSIPL